MATRGFGIDIGGSGIKGCPVDLDAGAFAAERRPDADAVALDTGGRGRRRGRDRRAVRRRGRARRARRGHLPRGHPARRRPHRRQRRQDLDRHRRRRAAARAAGPARPGASTTPTPPGTPRRASGPRRTRAAPSSWRRSGPGIGSALIVDGVLVPNTELGHLEVDGKDAETRAADSVREAEGLNWEQWAKRLTRYFSAIEQLFWPDLIVVGGGVSKKAREVPAAAGHPDADRAVDPAERRRHHRRRAPRRGGRRSAAVAG